MTVRIGWGHGDIDPFPFLAGLFSFSRTKDTRTKYLVIGYLSFGRRSLEYIRDHERVLDARVIGILRFRRDVSPELLGAVVSRLNVTGRIVAPLELRAAIDQAASATR